MQVFNIPDDVINGVAAEIHSKTHKDYKIPVVGVPDNLETPQVFEIMPFDQIDTPSARFYAIDGSCNSHTFYNGVSICFYQAGYVCFHKGQQAKAVSGQGAEALSSRRAGQVSRVSVSESFLRETSRRRSERRIQNVVNRGRGGDGSNSSTCR